MSSILVLDNYDSFTYNLVYILRKLGYQPDIFRNNQLELEEIERYDKILLSPGPGLPAEAGIMTSVIENYGREKSILGVCLGHQGIAEAYGAELYNLPEVLHGITSTIDIVKEDKLFENIPAQFTACHYHSWVVAPASVDEQIEVLATDEGGNIMALRHKKYDMRGVQFHPESILTEYGSKLIENWITE